MKNKQLIVAAKTEGFNFDISTAQIIEFLESLETEFKVDLEVINATDDSVDLRITNLPEDREQFAHLLAEIWEFSPDTYTDGAHGHVHHVSQNRLMLWWD